MDLDSRAGIEQRIFRVAEQNFTVEGKVAPYDEPTLYGKGTWSPSIRSHKKVRTQMIGITNG